VENMEVICTLLTTLKCWRIASDGIKWLLLYTLYWSYVYVIYIRLETQSLLMYCKINRLREKWPRTEQLEMKYKKFEWRTWHQGEKCSVSILRRNIKCTVSEAVTCDLASSSQDGVNKYQYDVGSCESANLIWKQQLHSCKMNVAYWSSENISIHVHISLIIIKF
jgi:hypothetical protein